jgi:DNA-binding response OmpR family regulator
MSRPAEVSFSVLFPVPLLPPVSDLPTPGGGAVLVVEDDDLIAELLAVVLGRAGLSVLRAGDGSAALRLLAEHGASVRLAMIDFSLPDTNGGELGSRLREVSPGLPLVLTSGRELPGCRAKLAESGPTWFVPKPYKTAQLAAQVQALMKTAA